MSEKIPHYWNHLVETASGPLFQALHRRAMKQNWKRHILSSINFEALHYVFVPFRGRKFIDR